MRERQCGGHRFVCSTDVYLVPVGVIVRKDLTFVMWPTHVRTVVIVMWKTMWSNATAHSVSTCCIIECNIINKFVMLKCFFCDINFNIYG